ncbi:TonB-dependent receptor [Granulicella sp. WH15]|uniref:TonB-dependent receptor n=1 Tax=Granulicella sp. WH15 TaxID=2602070 RepID=UPI0013A55F3A|nr:TonB-dependent receptor [Granulicella sp. WH15]
MRLKSCWILLLVLVLGWNLDGMAFGQEDRGRINGLVTDPTGAVVPKAGVTLLNEETGVTLSTVSDAAGAYIFELVIPGVYTVTGSSAGFKQYSATHVRVEVAAHIGIPIPLQVGQQNEQVTVQGTGGARLRTEDSVLGYTVESRSLAELPILYSNPFDLQLLAPGITSTSLQPSHTYEGGSESSKVDGAQSGQTEFTLDGAPDTRNGGAVTTAYIPSRDFVQETRVITSPYDASLAHTSGGSLDTSLKSGSRQFHGSGSWFFQPQGVDAPAYSLGPTSAPANKYDRESGEVSGPILPSKLFFFGGYERQFNQQAASTTTQTVPTDAEKSGDFSALLPLGTTLSNTVTCPGHVAAPYNSYQIFDPFKTTPDPDCPGQYTRAAVPGNVITNMQTIDPVAAKILSFYPEPTGSAVETPNGANNFVSNVNNVDHYWNIATRIDYTLNDRQKLFGHYIHSLRSQPGKNAYYPGASGQTLTLKNNAIALDYVDTLNATTVLNVRYSFTRFTTVTSLDAKTTSTDLGINPNAIAGSNPAAQGFPQVKITGYATLGNSDPGFEADNIHVAMASISKSLGRHQVRFGVEWREYQANQFNSSGEHFVVNAQGTYTKGPENTNATTATIGQALASLEFGQSEGSSETLNAATSNNTDYTSGYFQDDWKVTPKLTVNLGLRYEYGSPVRERHNKSTTGFAFDAPNPVAAQAQAKYASLYTASAANPATAYYASPGSFAVNGGLEYATPGGSQQALWSGQKKNVSPRIGFAYNPTPKLVIRGGYGIFFSHLAEYVQYGNAVGFSQTTNTVPTNDGGLTFVSSLANPFPNGLIQPSGAGNGLLQSIGTSITFFPQHPSTPYNERYSLGFQYQLPADMIVEADYVGNQGYHIRVTRDYDPVPNSLLSTDSSRTVAQTAINTRMTHLSANPFQGIAMPGNPSLASSTTIANSQLAKPFPEFTGITAQDTSGFSSYNALQLSLQKRFSHGYNMTVAYTKSRSLDAITFLNPGDAKPWYGVSNGDYPQVLAVSAIYELPFGKGKPFFGSAHGVLGEAIRGFQVQGSYQVRSGQPLTFNNAGAILRPGATFADIGKNPHKSYTQWFNTAAFVNNLLTGVQGQTVDSDCKAHPTTCYTNTVLESNVRTYPLRFNNVRQDYQDLLNVGALKKFNVKERVDMIVRAEALNALNHPVYSAPSTDPSSTSFGAITGFGNLSRILQFAVEARF